MKINGIQIFPLRYEMPYPLTYARGEYSVREALLLKILTDDPQLFGWGESAMWGGPHAVTAAVIERDKWPLERTHQLAKLGRGLPKRFKATCKFGGKVIHQRRHADHMGNLAPSSQNLSRKPRPATPAPEQKKLPSLLCFRRCLLRESIIPCF